MKNVMQREIKYKAKIKLNDKGNEFYEEESSFINSKIHAVSSISFNEISSICIPDESDNSVITIFEDFCEIMDLLQFTGLKDKNGVDIYEGDILQYHHLKNYIQQSHYGVRPEIDEMIIAKASDVAVFKNGCFLMSKEAHTDDFPYLSPLSEYGLFSIERVKEDIFGDLLGELSEEEQNGDCDGTDINESIIGIEVIGNIHSNPELLDPR